MAADLPLMLQTTHAELLDRTYSAAFANAFPADGVFIAKPCMADATGISRLL
jgi:hypothetical protein